MTELTRVLASQREDVLPVWNEARSERLYVGVGQLRRRRCVQRVGAALVACVGACAIVYVHGLDHTNVGHGGGAVHGPGVLTARPRPALEGPSDDCQAGYCSGPQGTVFDADPEALMDAADAARSHGHPEAAAFYLRRLLHQHRESPLAPLAAFTLGRVLLEGLGQPLPAAAAFALARVLAPQGSLAQDALAREVEAWSKAGQPREAYERARSYIASYPQGRRLHAVQLYGGLPAR